MTSKIKTGRELASILLDSWRTSPPDLCIPNRILSTSASLLTKGGCAALAWFRIRHHNAVSQIHVRLYRDQYIASAVRAVLHETELCRLMHGLEAAGIRSILLKGWSVARLYPETGLRPSGDIDLWVDPEYRERADAIISNLSIAPAVDLEHDQFRRFENRSFDDFYASCDTVYLGSTPIKVFRWEDQIRVLCLHFLKHGGWRPIWLCDIAVLLESRNAAVDWELCLRNNPGRARWIGCTLALARDLLGARIPDGAPRCVTSSPPQWFTRTVLKEWSKPRPPSAGTLAFWIAETKCSPRNLASAVPGRWRNAIQATVDCGGAFDVLPRLPFQLWDAASRTRRFLRNFRNSSDTSTKSTSLTWRSRAHDSELESSLLTAGSCGNDK